MEPEPTATVGVIWEPTEVPTELPAIEIPETEAPIESEPANSFNPIIIIVLVAVCGIIVGIGIFVWKRMQ